MNIIFKKDKQPSGKLVKGYLPNWNYTRNSGNFAKGKDFLSLHWEVKDDSLNIVRFHVESPKYEIDKELNRIKYKIIVGILASILEIEKLITVGEVKTGTMLNNIDNDKCTEVFRVILNSGCILTSYDENIELVNHQVGKVINKVVSRYSNEIKNLGLNEQSDKVD